MFTRSFYFLPRCRLSFLRFVLFLNAVPGLNYELTNFLQGYIDAEVNLNVDGSCALTCGDYQNTKHYACHPGTLCAELKPENRATIGCKGKVRGCHSLDDDISVCPGVSRLRSLPSDFDVRCIFV